MMRASHVASGGIVNSPDPCIATWTNFSFMMYASPFSPNTFWTGANAVFQASVLSMSHGDEPDTPLYAPTIGPAFFPMGVPKVLVNGIPAIALMCPSISNAGNASSGAVMIPSATKVFMMYRADDPATAASEPAPGDAATAASPGPSNGGPTPVSRADLRALARALETPAGPGCGALLPGGVGYLRIGTFTSAMPAMVHGALKDLEARGMESLIIDLRDSPGGELTAALELAGDFLPAGTLLCTLRDGDGDDTEARARPGASWPMPVTVLVNRATASAAELFAGCLQAHGRAVIAGERTYGKGVVQTVASRTEDANLERMSIATCVLPNGVAIQGTGVVPDIEFAVAAPDQNVQVWSHSPSPGPGAG